MSRRRGWKTQLKESTQKNIERAQRFKAKARTRKPKVGDWRTRTDGRLTREGEKPKFQIDDRRQGDIAVGKALRRPMKVQKVETVWERAEKEEKRRQDGYRKRIEEHKARMNRLKEIKLLVDRCNDSDPVRRAMAKAEFEKKYPDEYRHYFETGKIDAPEKEHKPVSIILKRPKKEEKPKEEPKPKEEKKMFSAEEIEEAVEDSEHEEMVEAKKKKEHEIELQQQYG